MVNSLRYRCFLTSKTFSVWRGTYFFANACVGWAHSPFYKEVNSVTCSLMFWIDAGTVCFGNQDYSTAEF